MRVSVIVPVYNKAKYLKRCIDSILNQSFVGLELIIVDDGSTDDSLKIIDAIEDPRIRVITQENAGPGAARNRGIENARGDLLAFLDADDEWLPDYLKESVALLDSAGRNTAAVTSGYYEFPKGNSTEAMWQKRGIRNQELCLSPDLPPMLVVNYLAFMCSWSTVSRRGPIERLGGFYSDNHCTYAEDSYLWLQVLFNERVQFNTKPLVNFHREASELSNSSSGPHPIEPFLLFPEAIRNRCPAHLRELLQKVLDIRAFKTACVMGYWGKWRKARDLLKNYAHTSSVGLPYFVPALVCSTPIGSLLGELSRDVSSGKMPRMNDLVNCFNE